MIHAADPQSQIIVFAQVVRPYVHPHFSKSSKTKQIPSEDNVNYYKTVGMAEWIIDDTCIMKAIFPIL